MPTFAKAITAAVVAGFGSLAVAASDNSIVLGEAIGATSVAVAAFGAVYGIRNGKG